MRTIDELVELVELIELVGCDTGIYVRYSAGPDEDARRSSRDHEADVYLPGLPVTNLCASGITSGSGWAATPPDRAERTAP